MWPSVHHCPHYPWSPSWELNVRCHLSPNLWFLHQRVMSKVKYFGSPPISNKSGLFLLPACPWGEPPVLLYRVARVAVYFQGCLWSQPLLCHNNHHHSYHHITFIGPLSGCVHNERRKIALSLSEGQNLVGKEDRANRAAGGRKI